MAFFHFNQNNSGGTFDFSETDGITHHVVIEARDAQEANALAIQKGLYFDGCSDGRDCNCCGDRWYARGVYGDEPGDAEPMVYGRPASQYKPIFGRGWMEDGKEIAVHHLDGRIEWFGCNKVEAA